MINILIIFSCFSFTDLLTFSTTTNDETLYENIKSFGYITTTQRDEDEDENEESFVFADREVEHESEADDDGIEIIKHHHHQQHQTDDEWLLKTMTKSSSTENESRDNEDCWLIQNGANIVVKDTVDTTTTSFGNEWLVNKTKNDRNIFDGGYESSKFKGMHIDESPVSMHPYLSQKSSKNKDEDDQELSLHSFLHHTSKWNHDSYSYPKRSFLDHWDFLENQDASVYLITKDDDVTAVVEKESERCQWLYRKDDCKANGEC